ncbi:putative 3-demethylubiquinone-9 3-methyltransferase (glyoxalase superfamily) [Nocardiopsis sp. Huas11]|uniref:VOC family protein n=1 Tax=Nocardiopsis sp. Huas11 TaxID=2183912 RepID=UPI000EAF2D99|nr:VOC family protein [Nocardiopsis sp. Huas11]RKS08760.1 putative 3-demethylubiquinone-9 3-methyltransferase (glyoxalase superfamily) [Nocardiopsis sp. Huas11]
MAQFNRITPCLWFDTQAQEAAEFYVGVFENSRILETTYFGPGGMRDADMVLTVEFELDGQAFTALNGGPEFTFDEAVSFQISCADQKEVDHYWERLTEGGQESQCGWLKDRFGVSWQVVPTELVEMTRDSDPERRRRTTEALLKMGKIDLDTLRRAAEGS